MLFDHDFVAPAASPDNKVFDSDEYERAVIADLSAVEVVSIRAYTVRSNTDDRRRLEVARPMLDRESSNPHQSSN